MPVLHARGRGDHRILVNVVIPRRLSPEQQELLGRFAATADEQTYAADDGFFQRLKSAFR
jgi:molecular chaperone DnaJ